jgi:predicted peroxiredoxin
MGVKRDEMMDSMELAGVADFAAASKKSKATPSI